MFRLISLSLNLSEIAWTVPDHEHSDNQSPNHQYQSSFQVHFPSPPTPNQSLNDHRRNKKAPAKKFKKNPMPMVDRKEIKEEKMQRIGMYMCTGQMSKGSSSRWVGR